MNNGTANGRMVFPKPEKVCGTCVHFVKDPPTAQNLAPETGSCRQGPPHLTLILMQGPGGKAVLNKFCDYPLVNLTYPACSKHDPVAAKLIDAE